MSNKTGPILLTLLLISVGALGSQCDRTKCNGKYCTGNNVEGIESRIIKTRPSLNEITNSKTGNIEIDTVDIHGHPHEILMRYDSRWSGAHRGIGWGGMMHSPECWCLKDSAKQ